MKVRVGNIEIGGNKRFTLIAGPCAIENREITLYTARELKRACEKLNIDLIFKSSFDKANRTSNSARGVGLEQGLQILAEVKNELGLPILTDVHESWQCEKVAPVADVLQIPAFLSRQTDLIVAAAQTGKVVNVKKGQFMAPWDMKGVISKYEHACEHLGGLLLTERGSSFGYGNLVVDMRSMVEMRQLGYPVIFDATHSVQCPSSQEGITKGYREMVLPLMRSALALGIDGLFLEVHPDPKQAISDAANQLYLSSIEDVLRQAILIDNAAKQCADFIANEPMSVVSEPAHKPLVKLLLTDVDGVLTDGGMYYGNSGDELKRFQVKDGMGLQLLQKSGVKVGIVTSEANTLLERRAKKLGVDFLVQGKRNSGKLQMAQNICDELHISLDEVAYIGDDVNCKEILEHVGLAACPIDAVTEIKAIPNIHILSKRGGQGCVRELCDYVLRES